jgi:hypothetical protein
MSGHRFSAGFDQYFSIVNVRTLLACCPVISPDFLTNSKTAPFGGSPVQRNAARQLKS